MIKFFRRIRQRLLSENKFSKYLLYAIGEIVLVVIGILIALQINNWNEARKERAVELELLKEVFNGLENDLSDVEKNLISHKNKLKTQRIIIDWLEGDKDFHDSISVDLEKIHYGSYFLSNESPYQTLKQIGMRAIKNDSLRNQITSLYDLHYQTYDRFNNIYKEYTDNLISEAADYFNKVDFYGGDGMKPIDEQGLKQNSRYLFYLKSTTRLNEVAINQIIPNIIENINNTLNMVDHEIENRTFKEN